MTNKTKYKETKKGKKGKSKHVFSFFDLYTYLIMIDI